MEPDRKASQLAGLRRPFALLALLMLVGAMGCAGSPFYERSSATASGCKKAYRPWCLGTDEVCTTDQQGCIVCTCRSGPPRSGEPVGPLGGPHQPTAR